MRTPTTLKVILVQFNDVKWDKYENKEVPGTWTPYEYTHSKTDFEDLIASSDSYNDKNSDQENVYGSVQDYFDEMSNATFDLNATVLNKEENGQLVWVELPDDKYSYGGWLSFIHDAESAAIDRPGILSGTRNRNRTFVRYFFKQRCGLTSLLIFRPARKC